MTLHLRLLKLIFQNYWLELVKTEKKNCEKMSINGVNESPPREKFNEILVECKDLLIKKVTISVIVKINFRKNGVLFFYQRKCFFVFFMRITTLTFASEKVLAEIYSTFPRTQFSLYNY